MRGTYSAENLARPRIATGIAYVRGLYINGRVSIIFGHCICHHLDIGAATLKSDVRPCACEAEPRRMNVSSEHEYLDSMAYAFVLHERIHPSILLEHCSDLPEHSVLHDSKV